MNVVVNGLMTNYHKVGSGKVVVCLPGWGNTITSFSKLIEELQDNYTVLALDLPGFGGTQEPPTAWGLEDYANFVAAWLDKIGVKNVFAIIGHSYGGATAIYGVGKRVLKPKKLILLSSAGVRNKKSLRRKVIRAAAKTAKIPLKLLSSRQRNKLRRKTYEALGSDMLQLPHMEQTYKRIIGEDVQAVARSIKVPTLLVYGTKDESTPAEDGRILSTEIAGSKLEVIEGGGHFLHQEESAVVIKLTLDFLKAK